MKIKQIKCWFFGHKYKDARAYFLFRKVCSECGKEQVKIPNGGWVDPLKK